MRVGRRRDARAMLVDDERVARRSRRAHARPRTSRPDRGARTADRRTRRRSAPRPCARRARRAFATTVVRSATPSACAAARSASAVGRCCFDERRVRRAARERLESQRAGAGEEVEHVGVGDPIGEDREQRLFDAGGSGADRAPGRRFHASATKRPSGESQRTHLVGPLSSPLMSQALERAAANSSRCSICAVGRRQLRRIRRDRRRSTRPRARRTRFAPAMSAAGSSPTYQSSAGRTRSAASQLAKRLAPTVCRRRSCR